MEKKIEIKDGIGIAEQRHLMEVTRGLAAALTEEEFLAIVKVYERVIKRLNNQAG